MLKKNENPILPNNAVEEGQQPTGKLSFRDYLQMGISLKAIVDGCYDASIVKTELITNKEDPDKDYLRLEVKLTDRIVVENRFVNNYFLFEREIKQQLGISDQTMPVPELLAMLIGRPIKVWFKTVISQKDNKRYQNMSFLEPLPDPVTPTTNNVPKY